MARIQRAILSVTDKTGIVDFARQLSELNVELVSTGGTAKLLRASGIQVKDVSELTGFPEMLEGRVKTLHPKVHGGILHKRGSAEHRATVAEHGIEPIDMVVVNLYAFEKTAARPDAKFEELIENIDIGGPSMIRSAAKNFADVAIVTTPAEYAAIIEEMRQSGGELSLETKWALAQKAFARTAAYDSAIASTLERVHPGGSGTAEVKRGFPPSLRLSYDKVMDLRYGENPHQRAALYADASSGGLAHAERLQGKELSYNNIVDLQSAWELAQEFDQPAVSIVKHTNPCGCATGATLVEAYRKALECDPVSVFGGVIGVNRPMDAEAAAEIAKLFVEAIAAPSFQPAARQIFEKKKNLRLLRVRPSPPTPVIKAISGGVLVQDADVLTWREDELKIVTRRQPTPEELRALKFAWIVCKHVKSNAIVYAREGQVVGVGAGQMSRVDAARIGVMKAVLPLKGTVAASDAFFPFPDGVEVIAGAGSRAVVQPGGSVRDQEVIDTANRLGLTMLFTGIRHFRH